MKNITSLIEIEKITNGNAATLKELLTVFIQESTYQIEKLQNYLSDGNLKELKNTAHKIKSSLLLIGMDAYKPLAEKIEIGAEKDNDKTKQKVEELIRVYSRALAELKIKLEELA